MEVLFKGGMYFSVAGKSTSMECKILLLAILVLKVGEHLCVVEPGQGKAKDWNEGNSSVVRIQRNETIPSNESINNSSLPFPLSTSFPFDLKFRGWRVKRDYDEEADREKILEDHARSFRLFYFLGGIAIVIFSIIFLATLACFCCPSLYTHKRGRTGGDSLEASGSGASGSTGGGQAGQETTITAARSSSIVMATLPFQQQHRMSQDHGISAHRLSQDHGVSSHRKSQDYGPGSSTPSTSQGFTYSSYPDTIAEIATIN